LFAVTILGCNSAIPAHGRNPSSQIIQLQDNSFLIDCGEGTQMQLSKFKIKVSKISHIFISHLHGDHYFGLIGLLSSMSLMNRTQDMHIFGPALLKDIILLQCKASDTDFSFQIYFHELGENGQIAETNKMMISSFKVNHQIDCWGFLFKEKKNPRSIIAEKVKSYEIPSSFYEQLQKGEDYQTKKGTIIANAEVTNENEKPRTYAYCADTIYNESIIPIIKEVDLLYHETTYLKDQEDKASARFHSTTVQAGQIAKKAEVKRLIIGHYSSKYESIDSFLKETKEIFENTELGIEGACYYV
jgi:ribonuclease Z